MKFSRGYGLILQEIDLSNVEAYSSEGATTVVVTYDECNDVDMEISDTQVEVNVEPP